MSNWHGGKGDKDRTSDLNKYRNNWDLIDWSKGKESTEKTEDKQETTTNPEEV